MASNDDRASTGGKRSVLAAAFILVTVLLQAGSCESMGMVVIREKGDGAIVVEEMEFRRTCEFQPSGSGNTLTSLEWFLIRPGSSEETQTTFTNSQSTLQLIRARVSLADAGEYLCRARVQDGAGVQHIVGPQSAGNLTVIALNYFHASTQYVVLHSNSTLMCHTNYTAHFVHSSVEDPEGTVLPHNTITQTSLLDEGLYKCSYTIIIPDVDNIDVAVTFQVFVFVPIKILTSPDFSNMIDGDTQREFTVTFQGRQQQVIMVQLYKDDLEQTLNPGLISYPSDTTGEISVAFNPGTSSRADSGEYRVVVATDFGGSAISDELKRDEISFYVQVKVLPVPPTDITVLNMRETMATIRWQLLPQTSDEEADSLTLELRRSDSNGVLAGVYTLEGGATSAEIHVIPATEYSVKLVARNIDGSAESESIQFETLESPPNISAVVSERFNLTTYRITVTVAYTGGGTITHIAVSFRNRGTTAWSLVKQHIAEATENPLQWMVVVVENEFAELTREALEFRVAIRNERGLISLDSEQIEHLVLPGKPSLPTLLSSDIDILNIELQLSPHGSLPIFELVINLTSPFNLQQSFVLLADYLLGQRVQHTIVGLEAGTAYTVVAYVVNRAGDGASSDPVVFETPSITLPLWVFIVIAVCAVSSILVVIVVIVIVVVVSVRCRRRNLKRYNINSSQKDHPQVADGQQLDKTHELLDRRNRTIQMNGFIPNGTHLAPHCDRSSTNSSPPLKTRNNADEIDTSSTLGADLRSTKDPSPVSTAESSPSTVDHKKQHILSNSSLANSSSGIVIDSQVGSQAGSQVQLSSSQSRLSLPAGHRNSLGTVSSSATPSTLKRHYEDFSGMSSQASSVDRMPPHPPPPPPLSDSGFSQEQAPTPELYHFDVIEDSLPTSQPPLSRFPNYTPHCSSLTQFPPSHSHSRTTSRPYIHSSAIHLPVNSDCITEV